MKTVSVPMRYRESEKVKADTMRELPKITSELQAEKSKPSRFSPLSKSV